jgi:alcohol dehydrogenase class IV
MKQFYLPTRIVTGTGCVAALGEHTAALGRYTMLVCGARSLRASGQLDRALELLRSADVQVTVYDAVSGEPTLDVVQTGLDLARRENVQVLVGIGGGSAMDVAKAIAGLFTHPGTVDDYFGRARDVSGGGLPWIAVPTTAGTGAEVTKNAVLLSPGRPRADPQRPFPGHRRQRQRRAHPGYRGIHVDRCLAGYRCPGRRCDRARRSLAGARVPRWA